MADIIDAQNLTVSVSDGEVVPSLIEIGQVVSFSGLDGEAPDIEVSHLGSVGYKEFIVGLVDEGPFNLNLRYDPDDAGQAELKAMADSRETRQIVIEFTSGHTLTFDAYCKSVSDGSGSVDTVIDAVANMRVDGEVVFDAPA